MTPAGEHQAIAKLTWSDPVTHESREFVLARGATASIGREDNNDIAIHEKHISRRHAVINFRHGVFMISDLGSVNGTWVNDKRLQEPFPLEHGDIIRLYRMELHFSAVVTSEEKERAAHTGTLIVPVQLSQPKFTVSAGPQEGAVFPLTESEMGIGRTTRRHSWDISLQDRAVSRPHARLERTPDGTYTITDLGSANGTLVNGEELVPHQPVTLQDGDVVTMGETVLLYRIS